MPTFIVRFDTDRGPRYLEWSTVVDAPVTWGVPLEEYQRYYRHMRGEDGMRDLSKRIARADGPTRCSAMPGVDTLEGLILCNRAGKGETRLTLEQIIAFYCDTSWKDRGEPEPEAPEGTSWAHED